MKITMVRAIATSAVAAVLLAGCTGAPLNNSQTGAIAGSVIGGVIGHQFGEGDGNTAATIAGTILGGYIGAQMGNQYDRQRLGYAVSSGQPTAWQNPQTGYRYNATPGQAYKTANNQVCRPVNVVGYIDGRQENVQMTACRQPNGRWVTR